MRVAGFEPLTFCTQSRNATELRYTLNNYTEIFLILNYNVYFKEIYFKEIYFKEIYFKEIYFKEIYFKEFVDKRNKISVLNHNGLNKKCLLSIPDP